MNVTVTPRYLCGSSTTIVSATGRRWMGRCTFTHECSSFHFRCLQTSRRLRLPTWTEHPLLQDHISSVTHGTALSLDMMNEIPPASPSPHPRLTKRSMVPCLDGGRPRIITSATLVRVPPDTATRHCPPRPLGPCTKVFLGLARVVKLEPAPGHTSDIFSVSARLF